MTDYRIENRDRQIKCQVSVTIELTGEVYDEHENRVFGPQLTLGDTITDERVPEGASRKVIISSGSTSGWSFAFQRRGEDLRWGPDEPGPAATASSSTVWRVHASRGDDNFYSAPFSIQAVASR